MADVRHSGTPDRREGGNPLPEGWVATPLEAVNDYKSSSMQPKNYSNTVFSLFSVPIFPEGKPETLNADEIGSSKQFVEVDDILVCKINPRINRVWRVPARGNYDQIASSEWIVVRQKYINSQYLTWYFRSDGFRTPLCADVTGVGGSLTRAQPKKVAKFEIPLPPIAEQKIIAEKLDTLLAQVDTTKARLERIPDIIKRFRQSVLAAAVSGKLTEEWRGKNIAASNDIPETWKLYPAQEVCEKVQSGSTPKGNPFDQDGDIPFLKVYNIVDQKISFDYKPQFITSDVHKSSSRRSIVAPNDVLMNIVGPPLGKVAIVTEQYDEWNINQAITLFRADPEKLNFKFLYFVLCEGDLVRKVMPDTKGSVGQVNISLTQCREALIPLPPLREQTEIVRRVEELFAFADTIEQKAAAALERVNNLTQSILAKAFRGELTADWRTANPELISGDNSAEALLAKIQAEREALALEKKAAKKPRKNI